MIFKVFLLPIFCKVMATEQEDTIKTRLKTILQSERTIKFLNDLTNFGISLGNIQLNNKFINKVFQGEGISIVDKNNRKKISNDIIIDDKKILIRTNSITNRIITFKSFKYEKEDQIDFTNLKEEINNELDNIDYLFLIRIEEVYNKELDILKVCYHYYLFPSEYFKVKKNFPFLNKTSFSGVRWIFKSYRDFCFKYDLESLISFNICSPYISY